MAFYWYGCSKNNHDPHKGLKSAATLSGAISSILLIPVVALIQSLSWTMSSPTKGLHSALQSFWWYVGTFNIDVTRAEVSKKRIWELYNFSSQIPRITVERYVNAVIQLPHRDNHISPLIHYLSCLNFELWVTCPLNSIFSNNSFTCF